MIFAFKVERIYNTHTHIYILYTARHFSAVGMAKEPAKHCSLVVFGLADLGKHQSFMVLKEADFESLFDLVTWMIQIDSLSCIFGYVFRSMSSELSSWTLEIDSRGASTANHAVDVSSVSPRPSSIKAN